MLTIVNDPLCIYTLKEIVEYYKSHSTSVYVCFMDAAKAFDRVNHWTLFKKMIDSGMPPIFVRLIVAWYCERLSMTLSETKVGCALGKTMVNHLAYADDLVILSPSVKGLQKLLNICSEYGEEHDIMFNHTKTGMYVFSSQRSCSY